MLGCILNLIKYLEWNFFWKKINSWKPLTIFAKSPILAIWQGSEYASVMHMMKLTLEIYIPIHFQKNQPILTLVLSKQHIFILFFWKKEFPFFLWKTKKKNSTCDKICNSLCKILKNYDKKNSCQNLSNLCSHNISKKK